ncbi:unnamed protein product [Calypogeia fissa]
MSDHGGGPPGGHHRAPLHHDAPAPRGESHESSNVSSAKGITVKIFSEAGTEFNLGVNGHEVTIVKANDNDPYQQWIKDESTKAKDSTGLPGFALINKGSGKALKHPSKEEEKVSLVEYNANSLEEEILWTESKDVGKGWHAIRAINNVHLNLDIDHGNKKPVKAGQAVIVFKWKDEENQRWKMETISTGSGASHGNK